MLENSINKADITTKRCSRNLNKQIRRKFFFFKLKEIK